MRAVLHPDEAIAAPQPCALASCVPRVHTLVMDELQARFELLKAELGELQNAVRSADDMSLRIKGWAVTIGLAAAGLALSRGSSEIALLGLYPAFCFWAVDAHRLSKRWRLIQRAGRIESALSPGMKVEDLLMGGSGIVVPGFSSGAPSDPSGVWERTRLRARSREAIAVALLPGTVAFYASLITTLALVALYV